MEFLTISLVHLYIMVSGILSLTDSRYDSEVDISKIVHCDGLLLCTNIMDNTRLVIWNPCTGVRGKPSGSNKEMNIITSVKKYMVSTIIYMIDDSIKTFWDDSSLFHDLLYTVCLLVYLHLYLYLSCLFLSKMVNFLYTLIDVSWHICADLDVQTMLEEAKRRWLRPNEIYAVLSNPKYFTINVKPMNLPNSNHSVVQPFIIFKMFLQFPMT